jgi:hypothetical protein
MSIRGVLAHAYEVPQILGDEGEEIAIATALLKAVGSTISPRPSRWPDPS